MSGPHPNGDVKLPPTDALYPKIGLTKPLYVTYISPTDALNRDPFLVSLPMWSKNGAVSAATETL
jgi:hypothetical protein